MKYIGTPGRQGYIVTDELEHETGVMTSSTWRPVTSRITAADHNIYDFSPKGFWQTTIEILKNGMPYAELINKPFGRLTLVFDDGRTYYFKSKDFWNSAHLAYDAEDNPIAELRAIYSWRRLGIGIEVEIGYNAADAETAIALPLILVYCTRYIRLRRTGA